MCTVSCADLKYNVFLVYAIMDELGMRTWSYKAEHLLPSVTQDTVHML